MTLLESRRCGGKSTFYGRSSGSVFASPYRSSSHSTTDSLCSHTVTALPSAVSAPVAPARLGRCADRPPLRSPTREIATGSHDRNRPDDIADAPARDGRPPIPILAFRRVPHPEGRRASRKCAAPRQLIVPGRPIVLVACVNSRYRRHTPHSHDGRPRAAASGASAGGAGTGAGDRRDGLASARVRLSGWPGDGGRNACHTFIIIPTLRSLLVCIARNNVAHLGTLARSSLLTCLPRTHHIHHYIMRTARVSLRVPLRVLSRSQLLRLLVGCTMILFIHACFRSCTTLDCSLRLALRHAYCTN